MRRVSAALVLLVAVTLGGSSMVSARPHQPPDPRSMAAIGDSITQAMDACCWYGDHPEHSWSTGFAAWDGVDSHDERLRADSPHLQSYNVAVSGSRVSDTPAQAQQAVVQRVDYVTILIGANDLCTSSPETMTEVEDFRRDFRDTLATLHDGLTGRARLFVSSIPDVYQLWQLYHDDPAAQLVWNAAGICQSLLAPGRTEAERQAVRERNIAFNAVLRAECAVYKRCRFDDDAVFNFDFQPHHVSTLDYFHPSLMGQAELAEITWLESWWS